MIRALVFLLIDSIKNGGITILLHASYSYSIQTFFLMEQYCNLKTLIKKEPVGSSFQKIYIKD